jgi:hypothetical protein
MKCHRTGKSVYAMDHPVKIDTGGGTLVFSRGSFTCKFNILSRLTKLALLAMQQCRPLPRSISLPRSVLLVCGSVLLAQSASKAIQSACFYCCGCQIFCVWYGGWVWDGSTACLTLDGDEALRGRSIATDCPVSPTLKFHADTLLTSRLVPWNFRCDLQRFDDAQ